MPNWFKRNWTTDKTTRKVGANAESLAEKYLAGQGLTTLARNYHCRMGEIDLIMQEGNFLVFVEVRYRKNDVYGSAAESVTRQKQRRILLTANYYLQNEKISGECPCRFDVITVSGQYNPQINWIKDAFQAEA
jgi:putative endonuclease